MYVSCRRVAGSGLSALCIPKSAMSLEDAMKDEARPPRAKPQDEPRSEKV
jgi:hypothetical protein